MIPHGRAGAQKYPGAQYLESKFQLFFNLAFCSCSAHLPGAGGQLKRPVGFYRLHRSTCLSQDLCEPPPLRCLWLGGSVVCPVHFMAIQPTTGCFQIGCYRSCPSMPSSWRDGFRRESWRTHLCRCRVSSVYAAGQLLYFSCRNILFSKSDRRI